VTDLQMDQLAGYEGYESLEFERKDDGVLLVTLNRPHALNAMTYRMHTEIAGLWDEIARDDATKVVVITGSGRGFSAGNDLKQPDADEAQVMRTMREASQIVYGMVNLEKPIITAINGPAVGAGLAVALMADIMVAAEDAVLIDGHTMVGVVAGDHACMSWPLLTSMAKAKYYLLTCEPLSGAEAERIGLVTMALPGDEVLPKALEIAARLARGSQQAISWTKRALNQWYLQAGPIFELSTALEILGFQGDDANEARAAFREKRKPDFPSANVG
jgi:enoyl-CoA hydratase